MGNVTGSVEDLGLTFYNPARLALQTTDGISINARAYEFRTVTIKNAIEQESSLSDSDFNSLPAMAAGTFSLLGTRFAYSYFSVNSPTTTLDYGSGILNEDIIASLPGEERYNFNLDFNARSRSKLFGLAWAYRFNDRLSLGVSLFGTVYSTEAGNNVEYAVQTGGEGVVFAQYQQGFRQSSYGLLTKLGISYLLPGVDLGLNLTLPYWEVYGKGRFNYGDVVAGLGPGQDKVNSFDLSDLDAQQRQPFGVSIGAGVPIGKHKLHLNVDYMGPLAAYQRVFFPPIDLGGDQLSEVSLIEKRNAVINFGAGAELVISKKVIIYSGFSTDKNAMADNTNFLSIGEDVGFRTHTGEDFFHLALGTGLNFGWGNVTLGATFTQSTAEVPNPFRIPDEIVNETGNEFTTIISRRWQFVVGLDIPFLNSASKNILQGVN